MRILWTASGLAFVLLTLAVLFRPRTADVSAVPDEPVAPRPLAAEDVAQIMKLREEFGSPADRFGAGASRVAFEEQLRQFAGLDDGPLGDASPANPEAGSPAILRQAAVELDKLANQSEERGSYEDADNLRSLGDKLRRLARGAGEEQIVPAIDDNLRQALIDNDRAPQAQ